jgi:diguanylate cyclase (GGDEF)-like protein
MESQIHSLTLRDGLTGLYNLRGLTLLGEQALQLARRAGMPFSVLYIDIDNLKHINDTQGHAAGSQLLRETSEFLIATFRETDIVARVGGDEFVVTGQFSEEMLRVAVRRLGELCSRRNCEPGRVYDISFSIGQVTTHGDEQESLEQLMARADRAMYETKHLKKAPTASHVEGKTVQPQPAQASPLLEQ